MSRVWMAVVLMLGFIAACSPAAQLITDPPETQMEMDELLEELLFEMSEEERDFVCTYGMDYCSARTKTDLTLTITGSGVIRISYYADPLNSSHVLEDIETPYTIVIENVSPGDYVFLGVSVAETEDIPAPWALALVTKEDGQEIARGFVQGTGGTSVSSVVPY